MRVKLKSGHDQRKFIKRIEELSGENVFACYQCGRCSAGCPLASEMDLLPNQIIRLVQMGLEVYFIGETITPIVEEGHVVVIVSYTGETMSAIQTANIVRRVGAKVVAITSNASSKLAGASNLVLLIHPPKDDDKKRLAPLGTLFEDATLIYLDGMVAMLMEKLGQSEGAMRKRHAIWV